MIFEFSRISLAILLGTSLLATIGECRAQAAPFTPALKLSPWGAVTGREADDLRFVPAELAGGAELRIAASEQQGLSLLDSEGRELARLPGSYASLDSRSAGHQLIVAALDETAQQATLVSLDPAGRQWSPPQLLPARDYALAGLCLYRDETANLHLFLLGEEGRGEQWLVGNDARLLDEPRLVRTLPLPPEAAHCQVDDGANLLFVDEAGAGLWAYPAHPEADTTRQPVDMLKPFGSFTGRAGAMAALSGGLLALDSRHAELHLYQQEHAGWKALASLPLDGLEKPERLSVRPLGEGLELLIGDDNGHFYKGELDWRPRPVALPKVLPSVAALRQSEPVGRHGDAADDPAIWVHPGQPALSRVLGTNKKQGLQVYDLDGKLLQDLPVGRLNNIDVRPDFLLGDTSVDLAVASNRDRNSITVFAIDRASGKLREAGEISTPLADIYGICLFQPAPGELYAFANGKGGSFLQYRLSAADGAVKGELVRRFQVDSQPEGCVADDRRQRLFLGEEDVGVWALDARPDAPATPESVIRVGEALHADVEGLALYLSASHDNDYLVISSQGNDSYVVLDAEPPYAWRGTFRVGLNGVLGIDGAAETDGLEVTSANLGGPWSQGMLVVQDGRKRMPEQTQNFKFVPWREVAAALGLDAPVSTSGKALSSSGSESVIE
ncbi:phytase [Azomonas macrocytogenes]|uniref:3-phytase n=1 Tax=Azomonas macrocytogenes TaxID=69962 RepID=A0A839T2C4_AZOMA|nr:phytase [Azomonas macrocytogenes]MBB3102646.1 3-phytase [Azomonas macrocytogenes]